MDFHRKLASGESPDMGLTESMLLSKLYKLPCGCALAFLLTGWLGACSYIHDDLPQCPAQLRLKFVFDYNLQKADAFATQVKSVNVWAFDESGGFVWSGSASGAPLEQPDFIMETPLPEGKYDFVAWCGLEDNLDFNIDTYTPSSKEELEVKLSFSELGGVNGSSSHFNPLFHGYRSDVVYSVDPMAPSVMTVSIPLVKDTNDIAVMLQNHDGSPIHMEDFSVRISYADSWLAWDNAVRSDSPCITYTPWSTLFGQTEFGVDADTDSDSVRSTLLFELSMCRLMAGGNAYLDVTRNSDGVNIIHLPLIEYFLLEKGNRHSQFGDQEYLDRRDDYSALFFIDKDRNWYMAAGIYINGWAVVPNQTNPL